MAAVGMSDRPTLTEDDVVDVPVEPLIGVLPSGDKETPILKVNGDGEDSNDGHSSFSEAPRRLADPSGIKIGKYEIPPRIVAPVCAFLMVALSVLLTFTAPVVNVNPHPWNYISALIGWIYFLAWGVSFLPQLYFNMRRWSVEGQSFEFVSLNIVGFACYSTYTLCFYANNTVQEMYRDRHDGMSNTVALNDVVFAVYALSCCVLNGVQIIFMDRGGQRLSIIAVVVICLIIFVVLLWTFLIVGGVRKTHVFNYLDLLYGLSMIKLGISIVKYWPQIYLNYKRKCTIGWNIWNVVLDFTGGILSIVQQVMDSWVTGNWEGMTGNPVKFALGSVSMLYDIVFFVQHFVLYRKNNKEFAVSDDFREGVDSRRQSEDSAARAGV